MAKLILKALIDEVDCVGCRKCSIICPTDAIIGAVKKLHTVLAERCTGCSKCVSVCPTRCIQLATQGEKMTDRQEMRLVYLKKKRLVVNNPKRQQIPVTIFTQSAQKASTPLSLEERKREVAAAIARVKNRKLQRSDAV